MDKILFPSGVADLWSQDYDYLQDTLQNETKKVFDQTIQDTEISGVIKGFNLGISSIDSTKVKVYHSGGYGSLRTSSGDIISTDESVDPITLADDTDGVTNYVYAHVYTAYGTYDKTNLIVEEGVQEAIDVANYVLYYDRQVDKWEIKVYTQAQYLAATSTGETNLILLGNTVAQGTGIPLVSVDTTGKNYIKTFINEGSISSDMISSTGFSLSQIQVGPTLTIDDSFSGTRSTTTDDLNELRTICKDIKGTLAYDDTAPASLQDFDNAVNALHENGVLSGYSVELGAVPGTGRAVVIRGGKAIVKGNISRVEPTQPVTVSLDDSTVYTVGNWSTKIGEEHYAGIAPDTITLDYQYVSNVVVTNFLSSAIFVEGSDYTIDYDTGIVTTLVAPGSIALETIRFYYDYGFPRYDIIEIGESDDIRVRAGAESATPDVPVSDTDYLELYHVWVNPHTTQILSGDLRDCRIFAKSIRQLRDTTADTTTVSKWISDRITLFDHNGDVDLGVEWTPGISTIMDRPYVNTITGGSYLETVVYARENDELWVIVKKAPWTNNIIVEYEETPGTSILNLSETFDLNYPVEVKFFPILVATELSEGLHRVRVTVTSTGYLGFRFYGILCGKMDTLYTNNILETTTTRTAPKVTQYRNAFYRIIGDAVVRSKGTIFYGTTKEICATDGKYLNAWDVEQVYPSCRVDQYQISSSGTIALDDSLIEGGVYNTNFIPTVDLLSSESHQRVGFFVDTKGTTYTSITVLIHDTSNVVQGAGVSKAFIDITNAAWNYWEIPTTLTPGESYHYHVYYNGVAAIAPLLRHYNSQNDFVEMYKPISGLYDTATKANVVDILDSTATSLITTRTAGSDPEGTRSDQSIVDIMYADLSDDLIWASWSYESYIGVDIKSGRVKFPPIYNADSYFVSLNIKEELGDLDARAILRHNSYESVEDAILRLDNTSTSDEFICTIDTPYWNLEDVSITADGTGGANSLKFAISTSSGAILEDGFGLNKYFTATDGARFSIQLRAKVDGGFSATAVYLVFDSYDDSLSNPVYFNAAEDFSGDLTTSYTAIQKVLTVGSNSADADAGYIRFRVVGVDISQPLYIESISITRLSSTSQLFPSGFEVGPNQLGNAGNTLFKPDAGGAIIAILDGTQTDSAELDVYNLGITNKIFFGSSQDAEIGYTAANELTIPDTLKLTLSTDSSSKTTGALILTGGVGVGKCVTVGENLKITGTTQVTGTLDAGSTNPTHTTRLNYDGNLYATTFIATSAESAKTNIEEFTESALDIISNTKIVSFNFKHDEEKNKKVGFVADNTHEYLSTRSHSGIDTTNSIGLLLKAVQELTEENKKLRKDISEIREKKV